MNAVNFSESEFYLHQRQQDNRWKTAAVVAAGIHITLFLSSFLLPHIIKNDPLLDQVITIDLVSMPEPVAVAPPPPQPVVQQQPAQPKQQPPVETAEKTIALPDEPHVEPPAKPAAQAISVRPLKRKKKKAVDTRLAEEKERERRAAKLREQIHKQQQREQQLERERRKRQAEAAARQAQREADQAAKEAVKALADMLNRQQLTTQQQPTASRTGANSSGRRQVKSTVEKIYYTSLAQHVANFWILPEMRKWDPRLEAVVVLKIDQSGKVLDIKIEKRSKDAFFDQQVIRTINNASPMPPIPKLMKESVIEVGFRLRPGKLENY